jgi:hypothetical protein
MIIGRVIPVYQQKTVETKYNNYGEEKPKHPRVWRE